ncbi:hypothetical protein LguiA_025712 [Lonicera macranthoides]
MQHIHHEDENTHYICLGAVDKVLNMVCCWVDDPNSTANKFHLLRMKDYLWVAEDGMKMQGYNGSQLRDVVFAVQATLASNITDDECGLVLRKAHNFIKISQKNSFGDLSFWHRHISKGGWTFSTWENGWPVSDCTAEGLKATYLNRMLPRTVMEVLHHMSPQDLTLGLRYVECTSSAIQGLGAFMKLHLGHRQREIEACITKALDFIQTIQLPDGSCYLISVWKKVFSNCPSIATLMPIASMVLVCGALFYSGLFVGPSMLLVSCGSAECFSASHVAAMCLSVVFDAAKCSFSSTLLLLSVLLMVIY